MGNCPSLWAVSQRPGFRKWLSMQMLWALQFGQLPSRHSLLIDLCLICSRFVAIYYANRNGIAAQHNAVQIIAHDLILSLIIYKNAADNGRLFH